MPPCTSRKCLVVVMAASPSPSAQVDDARHAHVAVGTAPPRPCGTPFLMAVKARSNRRDGLRLRGSFMFLGRSGASGF